MVHKHNLLQKCIRTNDHNNERMLSLMKTGFNRFLSVVVAAAILLTTLPFGIKASTASLSTNEMTLADNSTHHHWHDDLEHSTKEIGRIWTDKTVWDADIVYPYAHQMPNQLGVEKGDSDLLVELSALSSAASVSGKVSMAVPLDIVIVMDTSGSMAEDMPSGAYVISSRAQSSTTYQNLYQLAGSSPVYYKIGDDYVPLTVTRSGNNYSRRYTISYVDPGETAPTYIAQNDRNANFTLGYDLYTEGTITRLAALKNAVNAFIDQTKKVNDSASEQADMHRIALVEFASSAEMLIDLTYVNSTTNVNTLKACVTGLTAGGATRADSGMDVAEALLLGNNAKTNPDAQKVVIFFTDGTPTTYSTFSETVANAAINSAKALKDADTLIYTIGVYEEADPTDTEKNFNQYMHGMSSNYPEASAYTSLGSRAASGEYYLNATDASSLNNVFADILEDVTSLKANAATRVEEGNEGTSGYITFIDPLGKYMKVDDFKAISFAEKNFTTKAVNTTGNITTYTFEGENSQNPLYPTTGNLNQIIITVEKSNTLSVGDIVTVKIPGALIPIHYYAVNIDENGNITMDEDSTLPMRIWYGVSVKDGVKKALENPDAELAAYVAANKDADGNVKFYSNLYEAGKVDVYSSFEPNPKNNFYFFQTDEYLFTDEACTQPATVVDANTNYYYQRNYYHPVSNPSFPKEAEMLVNTTKISDSSNMMLAGYAKIGENGQLYIPKGSPRITSIAEYSLEKAPANLTGTSAYAINPAWLNVMADPTTVQNELGNNGIVKLALTGTLEITKAVTAAEGLTPPDKDFTFVIALTAPAGEALKETYDAQIFAADGSAVGNAFAFNPAAANTVTLKAGQTATIYGLADGTAYSITETNLPSGFAQVGQGVTAGQIAAGSTSEAIVTNHYSAAEIRLEGSELGLTGTKILSGREFKEGDKFKFMVSATVFSPDAPLPVKNGAPVNVITIEPTTGTTADFDIGTFTFVKPGEYHYEIREIIPAENKILGVSYDSTIYRIIIKIADSSEGSLVLASLEIDKNNPATAAWIPIYSGTTLPAANTKYPQFTNVYASSVEHIILRGTKTLNNKNLVDYSATPFEFHIAAGGSRPVGSTGAFTADASQPMPATTTIAATSTGDIVFSSLVFDGENAVVGKEFRYIVTEVIPSGATEDGNGNWVYQGVTYDKSEKEILIQVTSVAGDGEEVLVPVVTGNQFRFTNSYHSNTVTYSPTGEKVLVGRDFQSGDIFRFEIEAVGDAPIPVDGQGNPVTSVTIQPTGANRTDFSFGTISFNQDNMQDGQSGANDSSKTKTFTYKLRELALTTAGITYDTAEKILTLELKDNKGVLEILSVKVDGAVLSDNKITWTNSYSASVTYGGIHVIKTLESKAMQKDEFSFKITAEAGTPALPATDGEFAVPMDSHYNTITGTSTITMLKLQGFVFDQDDAGKTFRYIVEEVIPAQPGRTTFDKSQYRLELMPYDNGDGTMGVKTVITQIKDAQGQVPSQQARAEYDSANASVPVIAFTNKYAVEDGILSGAAKLRVFKSFLGRDWKDTDTFTFTLALKDTGVPDGAVILPAETTILIDKNTQNYTKAFGDIRFTQTGTYTFEITETNPEGGKKDGITYDGNVSTIVVEVANNGTGQLEATVTSSDTLTFVNVYEITSGTSVTIDGEKTLTGKDLVDGAFTFQLYTADQSFAVSGDPVTQTNENGTFQFRLDYTPADAGTTFYYVLREDNFGETIQGITYDDTQYHITVVVEDNGVGGITATKTVVKGTETVEEIKFENVYAANRGTSAKLEGTKLLTGKALAANEFAFQLFAADSSYAYSKETPLQTVKNTADGTFQFEAIAFDRAGTYYFVVAEDTSVAAEYVTFDETVYLVKIVVSDNGEGELVASEPVTVKKSSAETVDEIVFKNVYAPVIPEPDSVPKTGDTRTLPLWFALLLTSGLGLTATVLVPKKKEKENN
mgnify:CR=1 FL=1